jgi:GNAT superfamily N-acetyltransferase
MDPTLRAPSVPELLLAADALASWQRDDAPLQLHPGDLGWHSVSGLPATAAATRIWEQGDLPVAVGLLDGPDLMRLAFAPGAEDDEALARRISGDLADPAHCILDEGPGAVEARGASALTRTLAADGWEKGELWTPLRMDLGPMPDMSDALASADVVDPQSAPDFSEDEPAPNPSAASAPSTPPAPSARLTPVEEWAGIHFSAFRRREPSPAELRRRARGWATMAASPLASSSLTLLGRDDDDTAVAIATVWSAGAGRPGLLEPVAVHPDHRGRGFGRGITLSAVHALRAMGASSALVCTPSSLSGAVPTYLSAGFRVDDEIADMQRRF